MARNLVQERICSIIGESEKKDAVQYGRNTIYNIFLGRFVENISKNNFKANVESSKDLRKILMADYLAFMFSKPLEDYSKCSIDQLIDLAMEKAGKASIPAQSQPAAASLYHFPSFSQQVMADMYIGLLVDSQGLVLNSTSVPDLKAVVVLDELSKKFGPEFCQAFEEISSPQQRLLEELAAGNPLRSIESGLQGLASESERIQKALKEYNGDSIRELAALKNSVDKLSRKYNAVAKNSAVELLLLGKEADMSPRQREVLKRFLRDRDIKKELEMLRCTVEFVKKDVDGKFSDIYSKQAEKLYAIEKQYHSQTWPMGQLWALSGLQAELGKLNDYKTIFAKGEIETYEGLAKNIHQHIIFLGELKVAYAGIAQTTKALSELKEDSIIDSRALAVLKDACEAYSRVVGLAKNEHFAEHTALFKDYEAVFRKKFGSYAAFMNREMDLFIASHPPHSLYSSKTCSNLDAVSSIAAVISKFIDSSRYVTSLDPLSKIMGMEDELKCMLERPSRILADAATAKKLGAQLKGAKGQLGRQVGHYKGFQQWFSEHLDYISSWAENTLDRYLGEIDAGVQGLSRKFHRTNPDKYWKLEKIKSELLSLRNACEVLEDVKRNYR